MLKNVFGSVIGAFFVAGVLIDFFIISIIPGPYTLGMLLTLVLHQSFLRHWAGFFICTTVTHEAAASVLVGKPEKSIMSSRMNCTWSPWIGKRCNSW